MTMEIKEIVLMIIGAMVSIVAFYLKKRVQKSGK